MTGIVRHIGIADNFRRLLNSIDNFSLPRRCSYKVDVVRTNSMLFVQSWRCSYKVWTLFVQSCRCPCKVDVVRTNSMLFVQSWRCSYKVDVVRTKCEHYSYKVVDVLCTKLTLFCKVWSLFCTKLTLFVQRFVRRKTKVGKLILI